MSKANNIFKYISLVASYSLVIMGAVIMVGWLIKNQTITQIQSIYAPTHFNTALCILLMGLSIILAVHKKPKIALVPSLFVFIIATATIIEHLFSLNFGIDELFNKDYLFIKTSSPGRMGMNTAIGLMLGSVGLLMSSLKLIKKYFNPILFSIIGAIGLIAVISLVGYVIGLEAAYGWGHWTRMAINTSIAFMIMSIALFSWVWHNFEKKDILSSTIQWRLILRILVPVILIYMVDSVADINHLKTVTEQKTDAELATLSYQFAEKIDNNLFNATQILSEARRKLLVSDAISEEHIYQLLEDIVDSDSLIYGSALLFNEFEYDTKKRLFGPYVHKPDSQLLRLDLANEIDYMRADCEWFNKAEQAGKSVWTEPYFDEGITNILLCTYSVPIYHKKELWAVITLDLHLEELPILMEINTSDELQYYIVSTEGTFLYNSTRPKLAGKNHFANNIQYNYDIADSLPSLFSTDVSGKFEYIGNQSKNENWLYYIPINSAPWKVYLGISEYNAIEEVRVEILNQLLILFLVIIVLIIVIIFISRTITQPIELLNKAVKNVAEGDYNNSIEAQSKDEVGDLAASFSQMSSKLVTREKELVEKEQRYRALIESSNTGAWEFNSETNFLWCSKEYFTMLGRHEADYDLSGRDNLKSTWVDLLHPDDREKAANQFSSYLAGGSVGMYESTFRMKHQQGHWVWIWSRARTLRSADDSLKSKTVGTHIDVSKQKQTEEAQQKLVHEVGERMKELNCLYEVYKISDTEGISIDELLKSIANIIPPAWQFPDITTAKINFLGQDYLSDNFTSSNWNHKENILIDGEVSGSIEVYYTQERPTSDRGPFMKEEQLLMEAISKQIANFYIKQTAVAGLLKSKESLEQKVEERTAELQETEEKNRLILESAGEGILGVDLEGNTTFINSSATRMLGFSQDEILGKCIHDLIHSKLPDGSHYPVEECAMYKTYTHGSTNHVDTEVLWRKDGSSFPVDYTSKPISKGGNCLGAVITFSDITKRKEVEENLLLSRYALDKAGDSILWIDVNTGRFNYANEKSWTALQYSQEELLQLSVYDIDPTFNQEKWAQLSDKIKKEGFVNFESINKRKDGGIFPIGITASYIKFGEVEHIVAFTRDISERKKSEEELQKINMLSDNALELTLSGFWDIDFTQDNLYHQSDRATAIFGMIPSEDEIYKISDWFDAVVAGDAEIAKEVDDKFNGAITGKYPTYDATFPFKRPVDGKIVWIHALGILKKDEDGKALCMYGVTQDITERKLAEEKNIKLLTAVEKSPVMVSIATPEGIVDYVNPQYSEVTGFTSQDVIGKSHSLLKTGVLSKDKYDEIFKHLQSQKNWFGELESRKKDGSPFWSRLSLAGVPDKNGILTHIVIIEEDITERKDDEFKLAEAKEMAEGATKAKSEFLATMSHEIRTPMNAVIGLSQLALATDLDVKQYDYVKKINSSGHALLGIINDILDFSKIEAGKLNFENINFDLEQVFEEHANVVTYNAHEKGLEFVLGIGKDVPLSMVGDPLRLRQVLVNLVNNAIKFTHEGEISVLANLVKETEETVTLEFSVNDTGIGIGTEKQNKLFKSFSQADASTTRKYGGTGLGLAICKGIVEGQNGEIWVKSTEGKGSSFCFTLSFEKQKTQKKDQFKPTPDVHGLKVLLCDDNATALEILENTLEDLSFNVTAVNSGAEAIKMLEQHVENPFELLLLDWKMPEMNGIETIKALKNKFGTKLLPSIIMVTAYNSDEIYQDVKDMDISGLLVKPVNHSTLLNAIMTAFGKMDNVKTFNKNDLNYKVEKLTHLKGARVLLVEDNDINQQVAQELIETAGINVDVAENGQVAVDILTTDAHKYQLVFMDIQMPVMDGYTATKIIREDLKILDLPIVAMTADAVTGVKEKCLSIGMNDFITKPLDTDDLYNALKNHIAAGSFEAEIMDKPVVESKKVDIPEFENINIAEGLNRVNHNSELYADLLQKFHKRYASFELDIADLQGNPDELKRYIHTLKGTSGNIGAMELHKATINLELTIQKPEFDALLQAYLLTLNSVISELHAFIQTREDLNMPRVQDNSQPTVKITDITEELSELKTLINDNDLDATDKLKSILLKNLNTDVKSILKEILEAIDTFDFDTAGEQLKQLID